MQATVYAVLIPFVHFSVILLHRVKMT